MRKRTFKIWGIILLILVILLGVERFYFNKNMSKQQTTKLNIAK